jgi:DNA-binding response OmpR family regulator
MREPAPTAGQRVLVIEDDPATATLLEDLLSAEGYAVTVLDSALGAHTVVDRQQPAAVVLDQGLPYRRGSALLEELKADPRTAGIPVLIVSAYTEALPRGAAALAAAVVTKPFDTDELLRLVAAACRPTADAPAAAGLN